MKKKVRFVIPVVAVVLACVLILAPILFRKSKTVEKNTVVASDIKPGEIPARESLVYDAPALNQPVRQELPIHKTKPVSPPRSSVQKIKPVIKASAPVTKEKINVSEEKPRDKNDETPQEVATDQPANTLPKQPSPLGISVIAGSLGADIGVSYRLLTLHVLTETDLDILLGIKQAGIGLSKYVYKNVALGLTGTISYREKEPNIGVYIKYSL